MKKKEIVDNKKVKSQYWLMKTEPSCYSIDDLQKQKVGMWDGVRNYMARNYMRTMQVGDRVLFYHSSAEVIGVVGVATVAREAYPDPTQFDPKTDHYDPKSTKEKPRWDVVDVAFVEKFKNPITLAALKNDPSFKDMLVVQQGMRLSVQPVSDKHYGKIIQLAGQK
jgi:predicted RNA-binding protein with PUA-like domain